MILCRGARQSVSVLEQAFRSSSGLVHLQVRTNNVCDVTWTLHKGPPFRCYRSFRAPADNEERRASDIVPDKNKESRTPSRFITTGSGQFGRIATIALNVSRNQQSVHWNTFCSSPALSQTHRGQIIPSVLFTYGADVCSPRRPTTSVQTRASSMAAPARNPDTDAGETGTNNKGDPSPSPPSPKPPGDPEVEEGKATKTQQLKKVFKEYGAVGVSFHVCISLMSLGFFYLLVSSGIDMAAVLCSLGFSETVVQSKMAAGTSTLVLAYAVHKLFAPVRISITLVSVPLIVRYFRKTGLFRPPAP